MLGIDVAVYLPDDLLVKIDIATMAHSLEARSPLLDHDVMEFAASLPASKKLKGLRKKWLLRRAYRDRIPKATLRGRKRGFTIPLDAWLRDELRDYAYEVLLDPRTLSRGILHEAAVRDILDRHVSRRGDHSLQIWALLVLEEWQRVFIDTTRRRDRTR